MSGNPNNHGDPSSSSANPGGPSSSIGSFASSFAAFYPASQDEYPLFSSRRPSQSLSSPSSVNNSNLMPAFSSSKLRRESILASNYARETDGLEIADEDAVSITEDIDMDMDGNDNASGSQHHAQPECFPKYQQTARHRSLSQSTVSRSPPFPSSPPRSQQHLLARMTSEQQQALAASASSASSASYLIPTPYRSAGNVFGRRNDDLIVDNTSLSLAEDETAEIEELDKEEPAPRGFNPLNPYSLRTSSRTSQDVPQHARPDSRSSRDDMMEDSPQPDTGGGQFPSSTRRSSRDQSVSSESLDPTSTHTSSLQPSRSSPSLSALASSSNSSSSKPPSFSNGLGPQASVTPYGLGLPPVPATPPQNPGLRRSQSAHHRLSGLAAFNTSPIRPNPNQRDYEGMQVPHTAPLDGGSFPVRMRSSSFSGWALGQGDSGQQGAPKSSSQEARPPGMAADRTKARGLSQSSGSDTNPPRVVRRAVNHKKGSLMPKSKDHLRVSSQIRLETGEFEVASEAALHRISQSSPAVPPSGTLRQHRSSNVGGSSSNRPSFPPQFTQSPFSALSTPSKDGRPPTSSGRPGMPVKNRFPESAVDDEDGDGIDSSGSEPDYAIEEAASDIGMLEDEDAASNGGGTAADGSEVPPRPNTNLWSLRDPSTSMWNKPLTPNSRPGLDMDLSPSSALGWSSASASRPGKRKMNDAERFEPYNSAFKRRAVSPSASSVSLSPLLTQTNLANLPLPSTHNLPTLGPAASITPSSNYAFPQSLSIQSQSSAPQSPIVGPGTWHSKSRGSSPAPSMASSSGTGRRWGNPSSANTDDEAKPNNKVDLGKMSLA